MGWYLACYSFRLTSVELLFYVAVDFSVTLTCRHMSKKHCRIFFVFDDYNDIFLNIMCSFQTKRKTFIKISNVWSRVKLRQSGIAIIWIPIEILNLLQIALQKTTHWKRNVLLIKIFFQVSVKSGKLKYQHSCSLHGYKVTNKNFQHVLNIN